LAKLWDPVSGSLVIAMEGGAAWVEHLQWSPDGKHLATAAGKKLRIWDEQGALAGIHKDHPSTVAAICWRPDGQAVATASYGGVHLLRIGEEVPYERLEWKGSLVSLAWSPNARFIAAGSQEATVNFWKLPYRPHEQLHMSGYASKVKELAWDSESRFLATGGSNLVTLWDVSGKGPAGRRPAQLKGHPEKISQLAFAHGRPLLASGDRSGNALIWRLGQSRPASSKSLPGGISALSWSTDDQFIAWGTGEGGISLWRMTH
jgi:WD40 repeat protein